LLGRGAHHPHSQDGEPLKFAGKEALLIVDHETRDLDADQNVRDLGRQGLDVLGSEAARSENSNHASRQPVCQRLIA